MLRIFVMCDTWRKRGFGEDLIAKNYFMQELGLGISQIMGRR